jgi:hypothetical protein
MKGIWREMFGMPGKSLLRPGSWLVWAGLFVGMWGVAHVLGWRGDTAVLCGTADRSEGNGQWVMMRGIFYAMTYFAAVVVSPVLVLASGMYVGMVGVARRRALDLNTKTPRHQEHQEQRGGVV